MGSDNNSLNLVGSFINRRNFCITVCPLHFHSFQIAAAAENLESIIGNLESDIGSILFSHCGFHSVRYMLFLQLCRAVYQETGAAQFCRHVGQLKGNNLLLADWLAELDSLL